ncbi:MAG: hypothetical protein BRD40_03615 [Bacteroidetes bacterium QS_1_65_9]|nr:MAG: hypothetical protein BRD40_03615 [Bacteroidetes bacterium QS_1_65_9]
MLSQRLRAFERRFVHRGPGQQRGGGPFEHGRPAVCPQQKRALGGGERIEAGGPCVAARAEHRDAALGQRVSFGARFAQGVVQLVSVEEAARDLLGAG